MPPPCGATRVLGDRDLQGVHGATWGSRGPRSGERPSVSASLSGSRQVSAALGAAPCRC